MSETDHVKPSLYAIMAPAVLALLLAFSVIGLFIAGWRGGSAEGERVHIHVESSCPDLWAERLLQRATSIGLGEPEVLVDEFRVTLTATLPGLEDDREAMPVLLTGIGRYSLYAGEEPEGDPLATEADFTEINLNLNLKGHPVVELTFQPQAAGRIRDAGSPLVHLLDGEIIDRFTAPEPVRGDEMRIQPRLQTLREELRVATDWNILLRHGPAPCEAESVQLVAAE